MIDHESALDLMAAAFDFELSPADDEALTAHLEGCESCRATGAQLRADAVALVGLQREDAPEDLRQRIIDTASSGAEFVGDAPVPAVTPRARGILVHFPARLRQPAVLVAAAAVIVAVVGGTLAWRNVPSQGSLAIANPTNPPANGSAGPGSTGRPGDPAPANPPGPTNPDLVTAWAPVADLTAQKSSGGVVDLDSGFLLASHTSTPASELAGRVTVKPALTLTATTEADGRVRLTPAEPLTPGAVYEFTLAGDAGETLDTWAFQARQPLQVIGTLPQDGETDIRLDSGIEVTFDQDGVVDAASHMSIEPKVDGRFELHDRVLTFVPAKLAPATVYTVTVTRGVTVEETGEALQEDVRFQFETAATTERPAESTFRFANDLFESATAARPTIAMWWYGNVSGDDSEEPKAPDSVRLEVYRLADRTAAIDAFQTIRSTPRWSTWNDIDHVPTDGLSRVAGLDAHLEDAQGTLWTRLPEPLPAGWFLVEWPSETHRAQAILQVTDIASYLLVSESDTLIWANDLATGQPVAGAVVATEGATLGRTGADGTLSVDTPPGLVPDLDRTCASACTPVVTVEADGQAAFMPATGANNPDGKEGNDWWDSSFGGHARYWSLFHTDRLRYRRTDTVNVWGMLRNRDSGRVPGAVTLRLTLADQALGDAPIAQVDATPRATGAFTGSLALEDVPEGAYQVELVQAGEVIASRSLEVGRILKPAYQLELVTGRRVYIVGDRVKVTATARFYEGTPVPGVRLRMSGFRDATPTTDATGTAIVRGTARFSEDYQPEDADLQAVFVTPARPEEGDIEGASREFLVFPSMWTVTGDGEIRTGRVRISGTVNVVDRDRLEAEIADGASVWGLDPRGTPVRNRTVTATLTELIPVRTQTGTTYDFVEKRVVPVYEYNTREEAAGTIKLTTDRRGRFSGSVPASNDDHDYNVKLTITDPDGHRATRTVYASTGHAVEDQFERADLRLTDPQADQVDGYGVGEEIDLTMQESGEPAGADGDRHLFYVAQLGLREAVVRPSSRFITRFPAWGPPNVVIGSVRFTGAGYVAAGRFEAQFRASDRAITVELQPDKARYAPGSEVTLAVRTRDAKGRPLPATVIIRAVDEKLYSIGGASDDDPLRELYAGLGSGIRATYASHQAPRQRPGGADTGGGGDTDAEFRDAVLFQAVDTGSDGRASVTFRVSADLTSWHVSGSAIGAGLESGMGSTQIPVGLPFFVDAAIAPEYLVADRPVIQIRGFGSSLDPDATVTFAVDSDSLELHRTGLRATAFEAVTVRLPALKLGTHSITISARTGSGDGARTYRVTRTFDVVASRLSRTRTSYEDLSGRTAVTGGSGLTEIVVSDAGAGRELPRLLELASGGGARLERALAADLAASLIAKRFGGAGIDPSVVAFDGTEYQREDGGIAILPYASSDLEGSMLAALVAPDRFNGQALRYYFRSIVDSPTETRERRNQALTGLAGLGSPVLSDLRGAVGDPELTIRERLALGLGAAALGDDATARSIATALAGAYGEATNGQARLRVGEDTTDITSATAQMAMLMAAIGDPVAPRYRDYVDANPDLDATFALHAVGYVDRLLEHQAAEPASFSYEVAGKSQRVELGPGESFRLNLTKNQLATFEVERVNGAIGVTSNWREPVKAPSFEKDPDVKIQRSVAPSGTIGGGDLVVIDLRVTFGSKAAKGCHRVTELLPSGLVPVGILRGVPDPESGEVLTDITYPEEQTGQRVVFCADFDPARPTVRLRYVARVITLGTYEWEPTIVESRSSADRAAIIPADTISIR